MDNRGGKNKTQEKSVLDWDRICRVVDRMKESLAEGKERLFFVVVQKGISL